ncbi:hypothetical protein FB45DRAFT_748179 [Roridomyces roridus]|uniref:Zn(2)-C6 fungal-type domain-containing protein n=1 Tax=Roridomyces roridus TaxID=1738132 RepID=A0AAD7FM58_9AGAR|nr:hypothetical protein FB45DRAFT_748179 [Roridomyces roridus]
MKRAAAPTDGAPAKRSKATQACASCRRQKSRCEILEVPGGGEAVTVIRCHRCKVLNQQCSFETSDIIHFRPKPVPRPGPLHTPSPTASTVSTPTSRLDSPYDGLNALANAASQATQTANNGYVNGMHPEDLVPTAQTPIWGTLNRQDWTAAPILAMQELVRCPRSESSIEPPSGGRMSEILGAAEINSLLDIFETRYSPWLCAQPGSLECTNSLLDIVRCTIASRHLPPASRSVISPRLQKLAEDGLVREIFNPQPSLDSIKALLVLSVWTPICGTGAEARDGRLLIASAVSMAMNLHLQSESQRAMALRAHKDASPEKQIEFNESTERWRLWMYLATSESMLCIGTGRVPVSQLSAVDLDMTALATLPGFNIPYVRDIRLGLAAKMFSFTQQALQLRLKRMEDLASFFKQVNTITYTMEGLSRLLNPLPVVTKHDSFYSQMLALQYHACLLLIMHHALRETRTVIERDNPLTPWYQVRAGDHCVALFWGRSALIASEVVLTIFLTPTDLTLLSTAPDNIYVMVAFAATWIYVSNFSIHQFAGEKLGGASELLQSMTIARLNEIAHSTDHAAARSGHVLNALLSAWERRQQRTKSSGDGLFGCVFQTPYDDPSRCRQPLVAPTSPTTTGPDVQYYLNPVDLERLATETGVTVGQGPGEGQGMATDLFMDDAFWTSFVENLNSDAFIAQNSGVP